MTRICSDRHSVVSMLIKFHNLIYLSALMTASAYSNVLALPPRSPVMVCKSS